MSASDWILCNEGRICPLCRSPWGCAVRKDGLLIRCYDRREGSIHKDYDRNGTPTYFYPALGGLPVSEEWQPLWQALHRAGPAAVFEDPELLRQLARRTCDRPDRLAALRARLKGALDLDDLRRALEPHYQALRAALPPGERPGAERPTAGGLAAALLRQLLADGPRPAADCYAAARTQGISGATLRRARAALGVQGVQGHDNKGKFVGSLWSLPARHA